MDNFLFAFLEEPESTRFVKSLQKDINPRRKTASFKYLSRFSQTKIPFTKQWHFITSLFNCGNLKNVLFLGTLQKP